MPTQIGELFVKIGADVSGFNKGMSEMDKSLRKIAPWTSSAWNPMSQGMEKISDEMMNLPKVAGASFGRVGIQVAAFSKEVQSTAAAAAKAVAPYAALGAGVIAVGAAGLYAAKLINDFGMSVANARDNVADLAGEAGMSIENMSGLQLVAMKSGMSIDELAGSFKFLGKAIIAAEDETSKQAETFKSLGISITDSSDNLKPSIDLFKEIATALSNIPDGARKSTIEMELFGRAGVKLTEIMNQGGEQIQENIDRGKQLALVTKEDADEAQKLIDATAELNLAWQGSKQRLGGELIPAIILAKEALTFFIEESDKSIISAGGMVALSNPVTAAWYAIARAIGGATDALNYFNTIEQNQKNADQSTRNAANARHQQNLKGARNQGAAAAAYYNQPTESNPDTATQSTAPVGPYLAPTTVPKNKRTGGSGGGGKTPAEIAAEELAARDKVIAEWTAQNNKDIDAEFQFKQDQASLEIQASIDADMEELERIKTHNDEIIAEEKRKKDAILAYGTQAWQGATDIMANALGRMVAGQKVSGKELTKALGAMTGEIISQMGTELMAQGIKTFFTGVGYASNPATAALGASMMTAGGVQMTEGMGLKVLGSTLGALSSGGGGGGKGGGGHGGGKVASAPAQAALPAAGAGTGGTATINIVGGDEAIFSGKQVRALVEQINEQTAKGMTLRFS
jgi:hypothetical protein